MTQTHIYSTKIGALDLCVHSFSSIHESMEPLRRSITQIMVQYYERYGSYYNMLDDNCGNEGVTLRILQTML